VPGQGAIAMVVHHSLLEAYLQEVRLGGCMMEKIQQEGTRGRKRHIES
jgi:hypothetical protein